MRREMKRRAREMKSEKEMREGGEKEKKRRLQENRHGNPQSVSNLPIQHAVISIVQRRDVRSQAGHFSEIAQLQVR